MVFDPTQVPTYQSTQADVGLLPAQFQPAPFPGQLSAAIASGGFGAAAFMTQGSPGTSFGAGAFPSQQLQTFTNQGPMLQGPTGIMMPMQPSAPYNAYSGANPYAALNAMGPYSGPPSLFTPRAPAPPPLYSGQTAPMPFGPPNPAAQFGTPYMAGLEREHLAGDLSYSRQMAMGGVGARIGTDVMGAAAGAHLGSRIGGTFGGIVGGIAGFLGTEYSGLSHGAQNAFMNVVGTPGIHQRAMTSGIMEQSQHFMTSGPNLHASGQGFDHHSASDIASGIRSLSGQASFKAQTGGRFNQNDLFSMMQSAGHEDLLNGAQTSGQMVERVRDTAKSLSAFMQLAQEPDVQRAIQTMGQMRASGLNFSETQNAVTNGRAFARMAGQSLGEMMSVGGAMGSQTFQSMGLTQGLGMQTGMANYGLARGAQLAGQISPQMLSLMGGAQGQANMNNMFSASMLQMPMLGPSVMSANGGINQGSLNAVTGGQANAFSQVGMGANALSAMTGAQGITGLGMAIGMQPMVQDTVGRALQAQGPYAQRNFEDKNILSTMRQMGMTGPSGYMTMAQAMGMNGTQALARAQELNSPGYFNRMREQIEVQRRDGRASELAARDAEAPGFFDTLGRETGINVGAFRRDMSRSIDHAIGLDHHSHFSATTAEGSRRERRNMRSGDHQAYMRGLSEEGSRRARRTNFMSEATDGLDVAAGEGFGGLGTYAAGLLGVGNQNTDRRLADFREGSRLSGLAVSSSRGEVDAAARSMRDAFGQSTAANIQNLMAESATARVNNSVFGSNSVQSMFNLTARGAGLASSGVGDMGNLFGSRQMTGTDWRNNFLNAAARSGVSRERAEEYYNQNASGVVQAQSAHMQMIMTPEQRQAMFEQAERSAGRGTGGGGFTQVRAERETALRQRLFGRDSAQLQDSFSSNMENIRGAGTEGTAQNRESRGYVMAAAMLSQRIRQVDVRSPEGRALASQLRSLTQAAERRHVNTSALTSQITSAADRMGEGTSSDMARAFAINNADRTGDQLLDTVNRSESEGSSLRSARREADGFGALANRGGALADALRRAGANDVSTYNRDRVRSAIQGLGRDGLQGLSAEEQQLVRRIQAGGASGDRALSELGDNAGERGASLRRKYQQDRTFVGRWWDNLTNRGHGEDAYVNRELRRTTNADRDADSQTSNVGGAQRAAQEAGFGGAVDKFSTAIDSFARATQSLENVTQSGSLGRMIGGQ